MIRHNYMCPAADENVISSHTFGFQLAYLLHKSFRVHHYTIGNDTFTLALQNSGWQQVKNELLFAGIYCMTRVIAALKTNDIIRFCGKYIRYFTFTFISILKTNNHVS